MNRARQEDEAALEAELDVFHAMMDYGQTDDLTAVIALLKAGNRAPELINIALTELERVAREPKRVDKVAHRRKIVERDREIVDAFETRLTDWFGFDQPKPRSAEILAEEFAAKYGFADTRQVFNILKKAGYRPKGRKKRGI